MNYLPGKNKICAVIPFFNEESTLKNVVENTLSFVDFVIAVNDGSTDNSAATVENFENVLLINHSANYGKGKALKSGFMKSIELESSVTVTIDADGQHKPEFIPDFLKQTETCDIVIGNRLHNMKDMPLHRRASNVITSKLLSLKTGIKILDSQSGFRAYRTKILNKLIPVNNGFEAESEILIKAARNNLKIGYVNIPAIYGNDDSKMRAVQAITGFIKTMFS